MGSTEEMFLEEHADKLLQVCSLVTLIREADFNNRLPEIMHALKAVEYLAEEAQIDVTQRLLQYTIERKTLAGGMGG